MKQNDLLLDEGFKDFIAGALSGANMDQTKNLYTQHMKTTPAAAPRDGQPNAPTYGPDSEPDDDGSEEVDDEVDSTSTAAPKQPAKDPEVIRQIKGLVGIHIDDGRLSKQDLNTFMQMVGRAMSKLPDTLADGSEPIQIRHIKQQVNRDIIAASATASPANKRAAKNNLKKFIGTLEQMIKRMRD